MIDANLVKGALAPPPEWVDTPQQAQLRECLAEILIGLTPIQAITVCHGLVTIMRDQLQTSVRSVRGSAARMAREELTVLEIAEQTGQTVATIARLITETKVPVNHGSE